MRKFEKFAVRLVIELQGGRRQMMRAQMPGYVNFAPSSTAKTCTHVPFAARAILTRLLYHKLRKARDGYARTAHL